MIRDQRGQLAIGLARRYRYLQAEGGRYRQALHWPARVRPQGPQAGMQ